MHRRARLREIVDGRKLRFEVEVTEGDRTIGVGTHERRVIDVGAVRAVCLEDGGERAPAEVRIREVGPRDGFQNEPEVIPTDDKVRLIGMLAASGVPRLEVTSFVRPDVIPQLADAEEVLSGIERPEGVAYSVLIPNGAGSSARSRCATASTRSTCSCRRPRPTTQERQPLDRRVARGSRADDRARAGRGPALRGGDLGAFGCPFEGEVPPSACSRSPSVSPRPGARRSRSATRPGWRTRARWASSSPRRASDWARSS